jgi:tetrapyrrole methylase family protein/MazG family protein
MNLHGIQQVLSSLDLASTTQLSLVDGGALIGAHAPGFKPDVPALLLDLDGKDLHGLLRPLTNVYPADFEVNLLGSNDTWMPLKLAEIGGFTGNALFIPSLGTGTSLEAFQELIGHLRAPEDGCPWDKEQTHLSLRKHLLEESYEALSAMDEEDTGKMREELGDLLLQIVLNAQIGSETGAFGMADILQSIYEKIVRRHPHVFGEVQVGGVGDVLSNWEKIKAGERKKEGKSEKGILDGLPAALPALTQAQEFQDRAARVGFDWPEVDGVLDKVAEEIEEVRNAVGDYELSDELGDLFFSLVNLARWKNIDAEAALRGASLKFKRRFKFVEGRANEMKRSMQDMNLVELEDLWKEAKGHLG